MKIENLKQGKIIKNYKELCTFLDIKISAGNTKKAQLKELERFINYNKEGNKFIIKEIYKEAKEKEDNRGKFKNTFLEIEQYKLNKSQSTHIGIYKIQKDNNIYIGSTCAGFRQRFLSHYRNSHDAHNKTYALLHNGGVFEILFNATENNIQDDELIRMLEEITIKYYKLYTNYNVINIFETTGYIKNHKTKYKNIKIDELFYDEVIEILNSKNIKHK